MGSWLKPTSPDPWGLLLQFAGGDNSGPFCPLRSKEGRPAAVILIPALPIPILSLWKSRRDIACIRKAERDRGRSRTDCQPSAPSPLPAGAFRLPPNTTPTARTVEGVGRGSKGCGHTDSCLCLQEPQNRLPGREKPPVLPSPLPDPTCMQLPNASPTTGPLEKCPLTAQNRDPFPSNLCHNRLAQNP